MLQIFLGTAALSAQIVQTERVMKIKELLMCV